MLPKSNGNGKDHTRMKPPPWHDMQTFPRDGRRVEVKDEAGNVWLASWSFNKIDIDAEFPVEPTHWRVF